MFDNPDIAQFQQWLTCSPLSSSIDKITKFVPRPNQQLLVLSEITDMHSYYPRMATLFFPIATAAEFLYVRAPTNRQEAELTLSLTAPWSGTLQPEIP